MKQLLSTSNFERFLAEMQRPPHAFVRKNRSKSGVQLDLQSAHTVPWCAEGYALEERPLFTADPLLHAGCYYVQEQSSMFLAHVLRQLISGPATMIDFCAAPGGKSTLAQSLLPEGSALIANEPIRQRANILVENIQKWGATNVIVTNNYPKDLARTGVKADIVLVDAPCSGEGMFRKDPDNIGEWTPRKVAECQALQRDILTQAGKCLRPGGYLIYSTCTFNTQENEENLHWLISEFDAETVHIPVSEDWNICPSLLSNFEAPLYRFIPGVGPSPQMPFGEGLFMAVVRKTGADAFDKPDRKKAKSSLHPLHPTAAMWLSKAETYTQTTINDTLMALPPQLATLYAQLSSLRILHAGIPLAAQKGKDLIPQHALALSTALQRGVFPEVELTKEQALQYLHRDAITLPADTQRGFVLVTYQDIPLGFCKHLGNRTNNLYPQEWRIRQNLTPQASTHSD